MKTVVFKIILIILYTIYSKFSFANGNESLNPFISNAPEKYHGSKVFSKYHPLIDFVDAHGKEIEFNNDFFGFRNEKNYYFSKKNNFLLLMTGGSECAGYSHLNETISENLKKKLTDHYKKNIDIINLCQNSYTISNEINSYIHLVYHLKPDLIISHGGWNDIYNGLYINQPFLEIGFIYKKDLEFLTNIIYETKISKLTLGQQLTHVASNLFDFLKKDNDMDIFENWDANRSSSVVKGILEKIKIYNDIAIGNKSKLIYGLQGYNSDYKSKTSHLNYFKTIHDTHNILSKELKKIKIDSIDFQKNKNIEFVDSLHSSQKSVEIISNIYFNYITNKFDSLFLNY